MRNKMIFSFIILTVFVLTVSASFAANKTMIGYVDGIRAVQGVSTSDHIGTVMLTANMVDCTWDNLLEVYSGYTEDWQSHPAGAPADWRIDSAAGGAESFVVTGANNFLRSTSVTLTPTAGNIRINYTGFTTAPPQDFSVDVSIESTVWSTLANGSRIRMGIGMWAHSALNGPHIYIYQPTNAITQVGIQSYGAFQLRDTNGANLDTWNFATTAASYLSWDGLTTGASFTLRIESRDPIPVYFSDSARDPVTEVGLSGCYVTVEQSTIVNYAASGTWNTDSVIITTASGDTEVLYVGEWYPNSSVMSNINREKLPVVSAGYIPVTPGDGILSLIPSENVTASYDGNDVTIQAAPDVPVELSTFEATISARESKY